MRAAFNSANGIMLWVVLFALVLRVASLTWGVPIGHATFYHPDESKSYGSADGFPGNYLESDNYLYGTAIQYAVGTLLIPVKAVTPGSWGILTTIFVFRLCTVLMGTASVWLVYILGRKLLSDTAGVCAACFLAVAPYPALHSIYCTLDVGMSFLLLCGFLQCIRAFETDRFSAFVWLGVFAGLLLGTKIVGGLFVLVPIAFVFTEGDVLLRLRERQVFACGFTALVVFAVSTPHLFLAIDDYWNFMLNQRAEWYGKSDNPLEVWSVAAAECLGWPLALAALGGAWCLRHLRRDYLLGMAAFVVPYFFFWHGFMPARFVIVVSPLLCLSAAAFVVQAVRSANRLMRIIGWGSFGCSIAAGLVVCILGIFARYNDARSDSADYLASLPAGTVIGIATDGAYDWKHHQWRYPKVDFERFEERSYLEYPDVLVVSAEYDVFATALKSEMLSERYIWTGDQRQWYQNTPPTPVIFRFYDELLSGLSYKPIETFESLEIPASDASPTIRIYRRVAEPSDQMHRIIINNRSRR